MSDLREPIGPDAEPDRAESATVTHSGPRPEAVLGRLPTAASLRRELAAAARSLGRESSVDDEIADLRGALATMDVESVDLGTARRRVADASGEEERLKERVAALRGDVRARRAVDAETDDSLEELESAASKLSSVQTERIAAEQALERARERAARARDERERRLELRDRLGNRRRDARRELAIEIYSAFRGALDAVPDADPDDAGSGPGEYEGPSLQASMATIRIADLDGPVVIGSDAGTRMDEGNRTGLETVLDVERVHRPRS